ncbi:MAG TPA: hypothetical protein VGX48_16595 [Pyrinomonadaceae bacterium]|nr:hypothetical protein [Pyrinomonadaceae bacterium]
MSQVSETNNVNPEKLGAFVGKVAGDFAASLSSTLAYIGQRLGLYKAQTPFNRVFEAKR